MASASTPASRLKKLIKEIPNQHEVTSLLEDLQDDENPSTHRAVAIVGGALLERSLETLILTSFARHLGKEDRLDLFDGDRGAPLGSFSARIRVSFALGLFGSISRDHLNNIRVIRNAFAHSTKPLTFNTKHVRDVVALLTLHSGMKHGGGAPMGTPKERYVAHIIFFSARFHRYVNQHYSSLQQFRLDHSRIPDLV